MMPNSNQNFLSFLRNNWVIVLAIVGLISGWVTIKKDIAQGSERIDKIESNYSSVAVDFISFKTDIVEVKTTLKFIEQKIDNLGESRR